MDTRKHLIFVKGEDKTKDIKFCIYNKEVCKYEVIFLGGRKYYYNYNSIEWSKEPRVVSKSSVKIKHKESNLFDIDDIRVFSVNGVNYWKVFFGNGYENLYKESDLEIVKSALSDESVSSGIEYLKVIAAENELKSPNGEILLKKQYDDMDFVPENSALSLYLNPEKFKLRKYEESQLIFPFGGNASQFKAVKKAMTNQISIIQGPPGTGKTQTILNIIANLLMREKTIQIVSNNNSATTNILEKLSSTKYNMGFLVAALGNMDNKKEFIKNQTGRYPCLDDWEVDENEKEEIIIKISELVKLLDETFEKQQRLATVKVEKEAYKCESIYFDKYSNDIDEIYKKVKIRKTLTSKKIMKLWNECDVFLEKDKSISLWFKLKNIFAYGILNGGFYGQGMESMIKTLQSMFYVTKKVEIDKDIGELEKYLKDSNSKENMKELEKLSLKYLKAKLFDLYGIRGRRVVFLDNDIWRNGDKFLKEYPIVLSTTFSSRSCLNGVSYDYVIMDEASQVDIATGALALSNTKNAVIVGDLKQLPNVMKEDMRKKCDEIFNLFKLKDGYSLSNNSFLKSVGIIIPKIEKTMLREHYRCHPKIIDFCNKKFYNDELILMTENNDEKDVLTVIKTNIGNHSRVHINQRQIDVTIKEALPMFKESLPKDIGIIAPYKDQVKEIANQLNSEEIEVDTVHKFQGREKEIVVLTTVDDVVTGFSDDPYLLNVAISRAKQKLCLVTSGNEQPKESNISDLIDYIEYNNFTIKDSELYSIFDLLYSQYTRARVDFLEKHKKISRYDSENIMYAMLVDLLKERSKSELKVICHQPLNMLIKDYKLLSKEEIAYVKNVGTHVDFLLYNQISKKAILAIEVDGFDYHKEGTAQYERDKMKGKIMKLYKIPLIRFSTTGCGEKEIIDKALNDYS